MKCNSKLSFSFTDIFVCVFDVVKIIQRAKNIGGGLTT
jgi:hypothetical protein